MVKLFSKEKFTKIILLMALIASIALPLYNIFFIYPSFEKELVQNTEDEAVRVAAHLSSMFTHKMKRLQKDNLPYEFLHMSEEVKRDFKLWKLKIFSESGEIVYSTDPKDIGNVNKHAYFHEIVAKGNPYSVMTKKDTLTLEGQMVNADVAEIYVPIMRDGRFIGAFEIYYDVTARKQRLDILTRHYSCMLLFIGIISTGLVILLFKNYNRLIAVHERLISEITDHKLTEDNLNLAQEIAHIGSWHLDIIKNELTWSDETYRVFGIPIGDPMNYETFLQHVHPDDRGYVDRSWKDAQSGNIYDIEHRIVVNGIIKWVHEKAELIFNEKGEPVSGIGTVQDITEHKKTEEEKRRNHEEMYIKNKELERFRDLTVDREIQMIKLKEEVNALLMKLGQPKKYETGENNVR